MARLIAESRPIAGTLAEPYLRETRGLGDMPLPEELRFHTAVRCKDTSSPWPALLVLRIESGRAGEQCRRVQAVRLHPATADKAPLVRPSCATASKRRPDWIRGRLSQRRGQSHR